LQCPKLGLESFARNGVRPTLLPIIRSYFQNRKMIVKWHGILSKMRNLNGGGPQGGSFGILEYLSQTNKNFDYLDEDLVFKYIDDVTILEIVNLLSIGLASHNAKLQVPSHIPAHNQFIAAENLKSQEILIRTDRWSEENKMKLNVKKSNLMIFNYTNNYQFGTNLKLNDKTIEVLQETKLLGTIITNDLKWTKNTDYLVKKGNARMRILHKISEFNAPIEDLVTIYIMYVRSILELSCQVWHPMLTAENAADIERVQKSALKVILKEEYSSYEDALEKLMLTKLSDRREKLCLKFAKSCAKNELTSDLFPLNPAEANTRGKQKYFVSHANTGRYMDSPVPYLQRLLNGD
jgi:hypothetical protein